MKIISSIILTGILQVGCMKDEPLMLHYEGITPEKLADGWEVSSPDREGFDQGKLEEVYRDIYTNSPNPNIRSLLIARNGKIVSEAYFKDAGDRERRHDIMSVTKSITSMLTGIVLDRGLIRSIDDPVYKYLANYFDGDTLKRKITVRHLLTMETGLDFDNDIHTGKMFGHKGSSLQYVLSRPQIYSPGTIWYYGDGNPQLVSGIIQQVTGSTMKDFADRNLFRPLGIDHYHWENHSDGLTFGAFGLWLIPRDMLKIGQLMLDDGCWKDQQVVPGDWVQASTRTQAHDRQYGYYWYPENGEKTFKASGQGNQIIWVYPEKRIVVVTTSDSFARSWILSTGSLNKIFKGIVDAMTD